KRTTARSAWSAKRDRARRSQSSCRYRLKRYNPRAFREGHSLPRFSFIPREEKFYADFAAMADQLRNGARLLEQMFATEPPVADKAHEIKEVEHKCDFLTHEIIKRLNMTFVTPMDREDIHVLARALDDVMDAIDNAAALVPLYQVTKVRAGARELTRVIATSADEVRRAVE